MELTPAVCYRAVLARDARYDGRFFTCVKTTGIYCRPICPARPPKLENCIFVPTAAAAQAAGFRPCLRCRPESSPNLDAWRGTQAVVSRALKLIENGALDNGQGLSALADRLQIGERQLRRLFGRHVGAAPVTVAQTRRVLLAKQLIHQTDLSMAQVALASGFGSVRRFNETFGRMYQRCPSELRRRAAGASSPRIELLLPYRPPYDWESMLRYLRGRAIAGVETVSDDAYSRVIDLGGNVTGDVGGEIGTISVRHAAGQNALAVSVCLGALAGLPAIIARVRRMFDLAADTGAIAQAISADDDLAPLVQARPGLRVPGAWDGFEIAVRAVLGQQITVKAATTIAGRIVAAIGQPLASEAQSPGLTHAFPQARRFTADGLASVGIPQARATALASIAAAAAADPNLFEPGADLSESVTRLRRLSGIGEWTAQYIAMRAMGESDAFLAADVGLRRSLARSGRRPTAVELLARSHRWRPWRAYAVMHLWMAEGTAAVSSNVREVCHALTA